MTTKRMPPKLSHIQILVLDFIRENGEASGPEIREELQAYKVTTTQPAFCKMMKRLERDEMVEGRCRRFSYGGSSFREKFYQVTSLGIAALDVTWEFYANLMSPHSV